MLDTPLSRTAPARLYAILLKLRPMQAGTLMPFSGELVHGAWMSWLRGAAPDVVAWLHDGNRRRFFTCSSLRFPLPDQRMLEAERDNIHLPLDPTRTYTVRITLLLGELFPLFYETLMNFSGAGVGRPFMQIGKQLFLLEEVIMSNDDPEGWSGSASLTSFVEKAKALHLNQTEPLKLEFASLTTFNRSKDRKGRGLYYARLPLPEYIFPELARRWQDIAPSELAPLVQRERIEQFIQDDGVVVADYDLKPHQVRFAAYPQQGFVGMCKYHLRGPDEETTPEAPLTVRQQLLLLAQVAFYCGVGYKTPMGVGQVRPI
jgi:CRISPR-associated endoribonuclease Cas6